MILTYSQGQTASLWPKCNPFNTMSSLCSNWIYWLLLESRWSMFPVYSGHMVKGQDKTVGHKLKKSLFILLLNQAEWMTLIYKYTSNLFQFCNRDAYIYFSDVSYFCFMLYNGKIFMKFLGFFSSNYTQVSEQTIWRHVFVFCPKVQIQTTFTR